MEKLRWEDLERTQQSFLRELCDELESHRSWRKTTCLTLDLLEDFGVVRWTELDIDGQATCDFEPRFFSPYHGEISGLENVLEDWGHFWRPSDDHVEIVFDDEWGFLGGDRYANSRPQ